MEDSGERAFWVRPEKLEAAYWEARGVVLWGGGSLGPAGDSTCELVVSTTKVMAIFTTR